jgi:hypothetical protein
MKALELKKLIKETLKEVLSENSKVTVKVTFEDGNYLVTDINTDLEGAKKYYLGKEFNVGFGEEDNMIKAVKVEEFNG